MVKEKNWSKYPREIQAWLNHPDEKFHESLRQYDEYLSEDKSLTVDQTIEKMVKMHEHYREELSVVDPMLAITWAHEYDEYLAAKREGEDELQEYLEENIASDFDDSDLEIYESQATYVEAKSREAMKNVLAFELTWEPQAEEITPKTPTIDLNDVPVLEEIELLAGDRGHARIRYLIGRWIDLTSRDVKSYEQEIVDRIEGEVLESTGRKPHPYMLVTRAEREIIKEAQKYNHKIESIDEIIQAFRKEFSLPQGWPEGIHYNSLEGPSDPTELDKEYARLLAWVPFCEVEFALVVYITAKVSLTWVAPIDVVAGGGWIGDPHFVRKLLISVPKEVILGQAHKSVPTAQFYLTVA